jgi:hypothetical protein
LRLMRGAMLQQVNQVGRTEKRAGEMVEMHAIVPQKTGAPVNASISRRLGLWAESEGWACCAGKRELSVGGVMCLTAYHDARGLTNHPYSAVFLASMPFSRPAARN